MLRRYGMCVLRVMCFGRDGMISKDKIKTNKALSLWEIIQVNSFYKKIARYKTGRLG